MSDGWSAVHASTAVIMTLAISSLKLVMNMSTMNITTASSARKTRF